MKLQTYISKRFKLYGGTFLVAAQNKSSGTFYIGSNNDSTQLFNGVMRNFKFFFEGQFNLDSIQDCVFAVGTQYVVAYNKITKFYEIQSNSLNCLESNKGFYTQVIQNQTTWQESMFQVRILLSKLLKSLQYMLFRFNQLHIRPTAFAFTSEYLRFKLFCWLFKHIKQLLSSY